MGLANRWQTQEYSGDEWSQLDAADLRLILSRYSGGTNARLGKISVEPGYAQTASSASNVIVLKPDICREYTAAQLLNKLRNISGLTLSKLGDLLGVGRRSLHLWANGESISHDNHQKLGALVVSLQKIGGGDPVLTRNLLFSQSVDGSTFFELVRQGRHSEINAGSGEAVLSKSSQAPLMGSDLGAEANQFLDFGAEVDPEFIGSRAVRRARARAR